MKAYPSLHRQTDSSLSLPTNVGFALMHSRMASVGTASSSARLKMAPWGPEPAGGVGCEGALGW